MASVHAWIDNELLNELHSATVQQRKLQQQLASLTWARKRLHDIFGWAGDMPGPRSIQVNAWSYGGSAVRLTWHGVIVDCLFEGPDNDGAGDLVVVKYDRWNRMTNARFGACNDGAYQAIYVEIQARLQFVRAHTERDLEDRCDDQYERRDHFEAEVRRCQALPQTLLKSRDIVDGRLVDMPQATATTAAAAAPGTASAT